VTAKGSALRTVAAVEGNVEEDVVVVKAIFIAAIRRKKSRSLSWKSIWAT
jgi:hypothetical protein